METAGSFGELQGIPVYPAVSKSLFVGGGREHGAKAIGAGLRLSQGTHGMGAHMAGPNQLYEQDEVLILKSEGIVRVEGAKDRK